jgi:hypothetical protein
MDELLSKHGVPERPKEVLVDGSRLDGRGFEEFRPVCKATLSRLQIIFMAFVMIFYHMLKAMEPYGCW